ncbi:MAG: hypothetical protein KatS3mg060_0509 [Dehalococcoidia bacterium]|nr:MAG: hypothetical protein KatS3mg060_0509 [Dehalococcoidia bacterium]
MLKSAAPPTSARPRRPSRPGPTEASIAAAWAGRHVDQPLVDSAGRRIHVIYPGRRSGLPGPDFRDAILAYEDGTLLRGDLELHVRAADWYAHRHDRDPAYAGVVLHLVAVGPAAPVRLPSGALVPSALVRAAPYQPPAPLGIVCPANEIDAAASAVDAAGNAWLADRALRLASQIDALGEDEAAWRALAEAMGYGGNGTAFLALADSLPWSHLAGVIGRGSDTLERAEALLLGAAGLAHDPTVAGRWRALGAPAPLTPIRWTVTAVRPANRPAARIRALAAIVAACRAEGPAVWLRRLATLRPSVAVAEIVAAAGGLLGQERGAHHPRQRRAAARGRRRPRAGVPTAPSPPRERDYPRDGRARLHPGWSPSRCNGAAAAGPALSPPPVVPRQGLRRVPGRPARSRRRPCCRLSG